jgi:hypothetical protein
MHLQNLQNLPARASAERSALREIAGVAVADRIFPSFRPSAGRAPGRLLPDVR